MTRAAPWADDFRGMAPALLLYGAKKWASAVYAAVSTALRFLLVPSD